MNLQNYHCSAVWLWVSALFLPAKPMMRLMRLMFCVGLAFALRDKLLGISREQRNSGTEGRRGILHGQKEERPQDGWRMRQEGGELPFFDRLSEDVGLEALRWRLFLADRAARVQRVFAAGTSEDR